MGKLVYGVGYNDAGYSVHKHEYSGGNQRRIWTCPFYLVWNDMLKRCYSPKCQLAQPTYAGCYVDEKWHTFSIFRKWMQQQPWHGNQLDKDILVLGNKKYCEQLCVFVPKALNVFLVDGAAMRGEWPIGVSFHKRDKMFSAACKNPFTRKRAWLGYFDTPDSAHEAWRAKKHELACQHADMQTDQRIADALRKRYAEV